MKLPVHTRAVVLFLLAALLVVPTASAVAAPGSRAAERVTTTSKAHVSTAAEAKPLCRKLYYSRVMGPRPTYSRGLKHYPVRQFTCRAYWLAGADNNFVPQAVAVDGSTAWVSGYTYPTDVNHNRCRIQKIDLLTGQTLLDTSPDPAHPVDIGGRRADGHYEVCRHGGGLALDSQGLWISESGRVWLLNTNTLATDPANAAVRYWDTPTSPVKASVLLAHNGAIGIGYYTSSRAQSVLSWFGEARILTPGFQTLTATPTNPLTDTAPYRQQTLPTQTQGLTWFQGHGGLVSTRSYGACSRIVYKGRQFGAIPGLEAIEFSPDGSRAYLMSENTSRPFTGPGEHLVPFLTQVKTSDLLNLRGAGSCG